MTAPKFPEVVVQLSGEDGNAMSIVARVSAAMRRAGVGQQWIDIYRNEALSGDYGHVLTVTEQTVTTA